MNFLCSPVRTYAVPALIMCAVTALVYGKSLGHDFMTGWDDGLYIVNNGVVRGLTYEHLGQAFSRLFGGNYAPLHIISYMIDYELWGVRPAGFALTNLLLHAGNGLLLYILLADVAVGRVAALGGALLFLIHPVQVESVVWISQRKNLLAMFFFLAAFILFRRSRAAARPALPYALSLVSFGLALLAKAVAVILPAVLLLYELCHEPKCDRKGLLLRLLPFAGAAALVALLAIWSQSPEQGGGRVPWWGGSPFATFCNMLVVVVYYLRLIFWPLSLSAVYDVPVKSGIDAAVVVAAVVVIALFAAGIRLFYRSRQMFFWYALFFLGLVPVSQIIPLTTLMNDRYLYFPLLGGAALAAFALDSLLKKCSLVNTAAVTSAFIALCLALGFLAYSRTAVWRDDIALWSDTSRKAPLNADVWYNLGSSSQVRGRLDEALNAYLRVLSLQSLHPKAFDNLSVLYPATAPFTMNKVRIVHDLVRNYPAVPHGMYLLGHGGKVWSELVFHRDLFLKVLRVNPASASALLGLGNVHLRAGDYAVARQIFERALQQGADRGEVDYNIACVLASQGESADAMRVLERVVSQGVPVRDVLEHDPYLLALRGLPEFKRLLAKG